MFENLVKLHHINLFILRHLHHLTGFEILISLFASLNHLLIIEAQNVRSTYIAETNLISFCEKLQFYKHLTDINSVYLFL